MKKKTFQAESQKKKIFEETPANSFGKTCVENSTSSERKILEKMQKNSRVDLMEARIL